MKFILTSNSYQVTKSWVSELETAPAQLRLAFIDTAAEVYNKAEAAWLQADRQALVEAGFQVTDYSLTDKTKTELIRDLAPFEVLFVSGGNTFYLLEKSNQSGFSDLIKNNFFADKLYVGSSAGSVLLSNDLDIIKFIDDPAKATIQSKTGLGILNSVVCCHWGNEKFKPRYAQLLEEAYQQGTSIINLADNEYVVLSESEFRLVKV